VSHLDARMVNSALTEFPVQGVDLLFIENVGNLICPASYDLGEKLRLVVCSVTDGPDTPKKYPATFRSADVIVVNKVDLAMSGGVDVAELRRKLREANAKAPIFGVSCRTGVGLRGLAWVGAERSGEARGFGGYKTHRIRGNGGLKGGATHTSLHQFKNCFTHDFLQRDLREVLSDVPSISIHCRIQQRRAIVRWFAQG
jgi:CobW/HypB/UreG, nucleotide-binding domain